MLGDNMVETLWQFCCALHCDSPKRSVASFNSNATLPAVASLTPWDFPSN